MDQPGRNIVAILISLIYFIPVLYAADARNSTLTERAARLVHLTELKAGIRIAETPLKCGLIDPRDLNIIVKTLPPEEQNMVNDLLARPVSQKQYLSADGHFMIHYDTTGINAPDSVYSLHNSVPDWVIHTAEIAERAWRLIIDTLQFDPPPVDNVDAPEVDLYIRELYGSAYGWTSTDGAVTSTARPYDYYAYTELDNNYTEANYYSRRLDGLRVSIAHEFFHIVHLGYNWYPMWSGASQGDRYFLEMASTWMEERAYPGINDYFQYMADYTSYPSLPLWHTNYWYSLAIFPYFIANRYGEEAILQIFEKMKSKQAYYAMQDVLQRQSTSLEHVWRDFGLRTFFIGSRDDGSNTFPDASDYPDLRISQLNKHSLSNHLEITETSNVMANNFFTVTVSRRSNMDIELNYNDGDNLIGGGILENAPGEIYTFSSDHPAYVPGINRNDTLLIAVTNPSIEDPRTFSILVDQIIPEYIIEKVYPNPYIISRSGSYLFFNLYLNTIPETVRISLYNILGQRVAVIPVDAGILTEGSQEVTIDLGREVHRITASGVYFLKIRMDRSSNLFKITIIK